MDPVTSQPEQSQYQAPMDSAVPSQVPGPKHFLNKKFAITFVILLLLGGGAYAGIWWWGNQQVAQEVVPTFTPRPSTTPDPTADWKTYTNTEYGITFHVPLDWQVNEPTEIFPEIAVIDSQKSYDSDTTGRYSPALYISKQTDKYNGSITKFEATLNSAIRALRQQQTITIDGKTVYIYSGITPPTAHDFRVIFAGGNVYTITSNNPLIGAEQGNTEGELAREDFYQILSTFKFTDSGDTSTWKTYTNTKYGFEFKYPKSWTATESTRNGFLDTIVVPTSSLNTDRSDGLSIGIMTGKQFGDNYGEATAMGRLATSIAGETTYELIKQGEVGGLNLIGYFSFQSGYMTFSRSTGNSIVDQILSTFKFTK